MRFTTLEPSLPLVAALAIAAAAAPAHARIVKGPHLQNVGTDRITFVWEQLYAGPGTVSIDGRDVASPGAGTLHEVTVAGLQPGATYRYAVQAAGVREEGEFTTAPADPLAPFVFVVVGDNRSRHVEHRQVADAIARESPLHLLVNTGDMVGSGDNADDWQAFFDVERDLVRKTPWYPTVGNHEEDDGKVPRFYTDFLAPPTDSSGTEAYYSFRYANTGFLVLDAHANVEAQLLGVWDDYDDAQKAWLQRVLHDFQADPTIQHVFVFSHQPPFSSKEGRDGSHALRLLLPFFKSHKVGAVFSGDDHYLEAGEAQNGVRYYVMGGGGAPLYANTNEGKPGAKLPKALPWFDDAHTVTWARSTLGYTRVAVHNGRVNLQIKDVHGAVLHAASWNTGDRTPPPPPPDAGPWEPGPDAASAEEPDASQGSAEDSGSPQPAIDAGPASTPAPAAEVPGGCACSHPGAALAALVALPLVVRRRVRGWAVSRVARAG